MTSPEVSPAFGETLAEFVRRERHRLGAPFTLVEAGAGSGSLLKSLLASEPVDAWAVEASPAARRALVDVIASDRIATRLEDVPRLRGVVLANELLDNLPMAMAQLTADGWRERWVGAEAADLVLVDAPVRPEVGRWLELFAGSVDEGDWVEVQIQAADWLRQALAVIEVGAVVVIDYGDVVENLAPRRRDGTLRTYQGHHLGPHPLDEPGATDITADVNFTALEAVASETGAITELWRQDDFLEDLGLRERLSEVRYRELDLARKGEEMDRLRVRTLRTEIETLLHRRGLGDFRVLVARKGT